MKYKIIVEEVLDDNKLSEEKIEFETNSHDNIFNIVEQLEQNTDLDKEEAASLGVGLKLFTGVMLKNKDNQLFKNLSPHFKEFMMGLKNNGMRK